jgi:hypothetical protein
MASLDLKAEEKASSTKKTYHAKDETSPARKPKKVLKKKSKKDGGD